MATETTTAAGWIVWCDGTIYGTGKTRETALTDAREWAEGWDGSWEEVSGSEQSGVYYVAPATQGVLDAVRNSRPDVAHGRIDRVTGLRGLISEDAA